MPTEHILKTVAFQTLGCKTNQYDTQSMRECFLKAGYAEVPFHQQADVYLINTCTVTAMSDKKSRQMLSRANRQNPDAAIVLCGCYAQRKGNALREMKGVRLILGNKRRREVVTLLQEAEKNGKTIVAVEDALQMRDFEEMPISEFEEHTRAHLKIQDGCNQYCTYCIIPYVRGPIRSRSLEDIMAEAKRLSEKGYQEIVLTGIHLSSYGLNLSAGSLVDVVQALEEVGGIKRVRLGSLEPLYLDEDKLKQLSLCKKLCPHFHLSLQSGSDSVLFRMDRRYNSIQYAQIVQNIRKYFNHPAITTDVMVGFPGETQSEHEESLAFIKKIEFARLHVFAYSRREGTAADKMPGQVGEQEKEARMHEMLKAGEALAEAYARSFVGQRLPVLFETPESEGMTGYTPQYVSVYAKGAIQGEITEVTIKEAHGDGLTGEAEDNT